MKDSNRQKQLNLELKTNYSLFPRSRFSCFFYAMEIYKSQHLNTSTPHHITTSTSQHITTSPHQRRSIPAPSG